MVSKREMSELIAAIRLIAEGTVSGPSGLEALGMAIAGEGRGEPLGSSISGGCWEVAESIRAVASALSEVAEAIHVHGETIAPPPAETETPEMQTALAQVDEIIARVTAPAEASEGNV
jgi:hypothetical protein